MRFVKLRNGLPIGLSNEYPKGDDVQWAKYGNMSNGWISSRDLRSFEEVTTLASYITAMTGVLHLPADAGSSTSPRYDIVQAPKVGDPISYGFNGDYYPDGHIARITKNWMIVSTTGSKYNRGLQGRSGGWRKVGGTWSMVAGHVDERNPSF